MLTESIIKSQSVLETMTAEQIKAIITLAKNDAKADIEKAVGDADRVTHEKYQDKIQKLTGNQKPEGLSSFQFLEVELKKQGGKNDQALIDKISSLEDKLKESDSGQIKIDLAKAQQDLLDRTTAFENLQKTYKAEKDEFDKAIASRDEADHLRKVDTYLAKQAGRIKFSEGLDKSITDVLLNTAVQEIKSNYDITFEKTEAGEKAMFRKDGALVNDSNDLNNPITGTALLLKSNSLSKHAALKDETGGSGGDGDHKGNIVNFLGATTRTQALAMIHQSLAQKGLAKGSYEYTEALNKQYADKAIQALPIGE